MLPRRPPPVVLGPGAPVNCSPGDLGPTCTGSSAQTCGLLSSCFSAFLQDRGEEETTCAVLAGSGGGGGDAGRSSGGSPLTPTPVDACDEAGRGRAVGRGGVGPEVEPTRPPPPQGWAGVLAHPVCRSIPKRGHGKIWGARGKDLGPGRGARAEVRGADALGSGDPAHFPLTVHLPPTVAVCLPVSFCTRRDSPAEPG